MKHRTARQTKLFSALIIALSLVAFGAAFAGVSIRLGGNATPTGRSASLLSEGQRLPIQLGVKNRFPLSTNERPSLKLRTAGAIGRSRAISIQNVDLTPNSPSEEIDSVWSPDGTKILFTSNGADTNNDGKIDAVRPDATYHIWMMNADGSNQRQLTTSAGNQVEPAWSPNGLRIAYASDEGGDYDIYLLTLTDSTKVKLTLGTSSERHPTWAAGGDKVAFMSDKSGLSKIWSMKTDGTVPQMLSSDSASEDRNPVWSPDGQTIAFQSNGTDANGDGKIDGVSQDTNIWVMSYFGSQQKPITAYQIKLGVITDKEPAWSRDGSSILFSSDRKDTDGDGAWDNRGDFDVYIIPASQPETAATSVATRLTQRSATEFNALTGNETHPSLAPDQTYNPKVMFVSDQTGTQDVWITSVDDITKPRLTELPSVSPRLTIPGDTVTITARVSDQESGVRAVYAQMRDPDDAVTDTQGLNHKVFYVQPHHPNQQVDGMPVWTEVDSQMVNAQDYNYEIPPYQPPLDELSADYSSMPPSDGWLRLYDDGKHNDGAAGDGLFGNTWKTPGVASDYYLDIIAYDNVGNWKMFDGVWGFSTQQFTATHNMLLVMDYAQGQKFMSGDQARYAAGGSYLPTWFPVESYYTHNPTGMNYNPAEYKGCVINTDILDANGLPPSTPTLGIYSLDTFRRSAATEGYDLWRVICRGRISPDVIASYTPR
ncbi:MAG TPA: choice-of-anchor X domain-containing protein, partial [Armatimonadota bacterium]|nr:choice-of-anchor X domain-containing protein [Armatimonadota bacterium]